MNNLAQVNRQHSGLDAEASANQLSVRIEAGTYFDGAQSWSLDCKIFDLPNIIPSRGVALYQIYLWQANQQAAPEISIGNASSRPQPYCLYNIVFDNSGVYNLYKTLPNGDLIPKSPPLN